MFILIRIRRFHKWLKVIKHVRYSAAKMFAAKSAEVCYDAELAAFGLLYGTV